MITKKTIELLKGFTSKEDSRYALAGVNMRDGMLEATDGHVLVQLKGISNPVVSEKATGIIAASQLESAGKLMKANKHEATIKTYPESDTRSEEVTIEVTEAMPIPDSPTQTVGGKKLSGRFPNCGAVVHGPEKTRLARVTLGVDLLARLATSVKKFHGRDSAAQFIDIEILAGDTEHQALQLYTRNDDGETARMLIMPAKGGDRYKDWDSKPDQIEDPAKSTEKTEASK